MFKMGSHCPFWNLKHKLWSKERLGVKLIVWLPTIKSRESTQFRHMQAAYNILLESSPPSLRLCFRPHYNRRSAREVMHPQSHGNPSYGNFRTPTWESRDKKPFGCGPHGEAQSILKGGRWWLPTSSGRGESYVSELPMVRPNTESASTMH
jgi:hypothetical protein